MIARVFVPEATGGGARLPIPADDAAHLVRVLRLGAGAAVRVFDGRGGEWDATLVEVSKHGAIVQLGAARLSAPETRVGYTLAVAVLKGDGTDQVVRDAVMLGVRVIRPFLSARTEVSAAALARGHRRERWMRIAVSSAKQCGRAVVPEVHDVVDVTALWTLDAEATRLVLVEPAIAGEVATPSTVAVPAVVSLAVGPEGGWTDGEVSAAVTAGWRTLRVGGRVLRADAAPLVALAACQAVWADG